MADSYRSGRTSEVKVGAHRTAPETLLPSSLLRDRISFHGSLGINSHRPYTVTDTGTRAGPSLYAPERLLDADFPHERAKARIWAEGVEEGCWRDEHEPFGALLVGRLSERSAWSLFPRP